MPSPLPTLAHQAAFSLIEVVLALGITSFAIISIIGLLSFGLQNSRESAEDTNLALITQTTTSLLRSLPFTNILNSATFATNNTNANYFFDVTGDLTRDATGAPATVPNADSLFACTLARRTPPLSTPGKAIATPTARRWLFPVPPPPSRPPLILPLSPWTKIRLSE